MISEDIDLGSTVGRSFDLVAGGVLHPGWDEEIRLVAGRFAERTVLDGKSPTSREPEPGQLFSVDVVTGEAVKAHLPWLWQLYRTSFLDLVSEVAGYRAHVAQEDRIAININVVRGLKARYEWHVDSNPVTGLLFVDTLGEEDGGELCFETQAGRVLIRPKAGTFLAFDAREISHAVLPLKRMIERISIPMNYYASASDQPRPRGLDDYMYAALDDGR